jgi:hypothetical protein
MYIQLLNKGLIYNLRFKPKHWLKAVDLEAETAISYANESEKLPKTHDLKNN